MSDILPSSTAHSFNDADDFALLPEGDYEVKLEEATIREFSTGSRGLNIKYRVRADVEQPGKNRVLFETLFLDKSNPQWFDLRKLGKIISTTPTVDKGGKRDFNDCDEAILYINGIDLRVSVNKFFDERLNKEVNGIVYLSYKPSLVGPVSPTVTLSSPVEDSPAIANDLPF